MAENEEYARGILRLIELGSSGVTNNNKDDGNNDDDGDKVRWEPLAVGLRLVVDYLEQRTAELPRPPASPDGEDDEDEGTGLGTGGGGVYAEGPRIPKIAHSADNNNNANAISPIPAERKEAPPNDSKSPVFELMMALPDIIHQHIEHSEPRVRSLVAQVVGAYALYATSLLNWMAIASTTTTTTIDDELFDAPLKAAILHSQHGRRQIHNAILLSLKTHLEMKEPCRDANPSAASDGALDDTTGWRALETNLHALASYIDGCVGKGGVVNNNVNGDNDNSDVTSGSYLLEEAHLFELSSKGDDDNDKNGWFLAGLQHCCIVHVNRHVRAASAAVLGVLVKSCMRSRNTNSSRNQELIDFYLVDEESSFRIVLKESLRATLADNWSQVRMAGSVLCRRFVCALLKIHGGENNNDEDSDDEDEDVTVFEAAAGDLVPMLLPRMCLNRFYIAQGVKLYSQETWKLVFGAQKVQGVDASSGEEGGLHSSEEVKGGGGMGAVARNAAPLCRYYAKMCDADNHAVREVCNDVYFLFDYLKMLWPCFLLLNCFNIYWIKTYVSICYLFFKPGCLPRSCRVGAKVGKTSIVCRIPFFACDHFASGECQSVVVFMDLFFHLKSK